MKYNINTPSFWNAKNLKSEENLLKSGIYLHKNNIVLKWISNGPKSILNVGVGNGYFEQKLILQNKQIKLYGIDISPYSIKKINTKISGDFRIANIQKIPFQTNLFDYVLALDVLEHLNKRELIVGLKEICRVIKVNGKLIISVPINENNRDRIANRHMISFSINNLTQILTKLRYEIIDQRELYAFRKFYWIKSILIKYFKNRKPNLFIIKARKK